MALHLGGLLQINVDRVDRLRPEDQRGGACATSKRRVDEVHRHRHARLVAVDLVGAVVGLHEAVLVLVLFVERRDVDAGRHARLVASDFPDGVIGNLGPLHGFLHRVFRLGVGLDEGDIEARPIGRNLDQRAAKSFHHRLVPPVGTNIRGGFLRQRDGREDSYGDNAKRKSLELHSGPLSRRFRITRPRMNP